MDSLSAVARTIRRGTLLPVLVALGCMASCASSDVMHRTPTLKKPDHVQVRDFAVTVADGELDRGLGPPMRAVPGELTSSEDKRIGHTASEALAAALTAKLRELKIPAERARRAAAVGPKTLVIVGRFVTLEAGSQATRTRIGFGAGASEVRTEARAYMAGELVASADAVARSGKKPGGSAAPANVQADARRAGEELAKRIRDAYKKRGW